MPDMAISRAERSRWTAKLDKQNTLVITAIEDLLILVADAAAAGVSQADIAYNLSDTSSMANLARGVVGGTSPSGVAVKIKYGNAIRERRKASKG
jgi:hypothetical protein